MPPPIAPWDMFCISIINRLGQARRSRVGATGPCSMAATRGFVDGAGIGGILFMMFDIYYG